LVGRNRCATIVCLWKINIAFSLDFLRSIHSVIIRLILVNRIDRNRLASCFIQSSLRYVWAGVIWRATHKYTCCTGLQPSATDLLGAGVIGRAARNDVYATRTNTAVTHALRSDTILFLAGVIWRAARPYKTSGTSHIFSMYGRSANARLLERRR